MFQVIPVSVHVADAANTSIVRHAAGTAVRYSRSVASRTTAVLGIAGVQVVRSNRTYARWLMPLPDETLVLVTVPKLVVGEP